MKYYRHYHMKVSAPIVTVQVLEIANFFSDFLPNTGDYCIIRNKRYRVVKVYEPYPATYGSNSLYHVNIEVDEENQDENHITTRSKSLFSLW